MSDASREAGHGLGSAVSELSFQVGNERRAKVRVAVRQPGLEGVRLLG